MMLYGKILAGAAAIYLSVPQKQEKSLMPDVLLKLQEVFMNSE